MKYFFAAALIALAACDQRTGPTSPLLEEAVYSALGGMQVGESLSFTGADAAEILLARGRVPGEFVFVPFHASEVGAAQLNLLITGRNLGPDVAVAAGHELPPASRVPTHLPSSELHEQLHAQMQAAIEPRLSRVRLARGGLPAPESRSDLGDDRAFVGQRVTLNASASGEACSAVDMRRGRVEAISQRAIVVGDLENPGGGLTRQDFESFGNTFDTLIDPTLRRYFSDPTDIDGNGRVIVFFTRAVNEITRDAGQGFVAGFFWARDLFQREECPASNQGEIFFIFVPDPAAEASPIAHTRERVLRTAPTTIGHEYQHLINAGRRVWVNNADEFEEIWLDEGLSHSAEELLFYRDSGARPRSNIDVAALQAANWVDSVNQFQAGNLIRYGLYLEAVSRESPIHPMDRLQTRGAAWSFLRYAVDHGDIPDEQFFRSLTDSRLTGFQNLRTVLREPPLDRIQRWGVSVFTDDLPGLAGIDPLFTQPSWNFRSLLPRVVERGDFPLLVRTLAGEQQLPVTIRAGSSAYVRVRGGGSETSRILTTSGGETPPAQLRATVVRID